MLLCGKFLLLKNDRNIFMFKVSEVKKGVVIEYNGCVLVVKDI